jgi:glycosyltransferase involved in cell wall biosynthesis
METSASTAPEPGAVGDGRPDTWVIIPCYNEAEVVQSVVREVREHFVNVVCVDDGSSDASATEILAGGARLVRHPINLGAGAAYQTGIDFALRDPGAEFFVTFDADGQHRVEDAVAMVDYLRGTDVQVLIGSRFLGQAYGMKTSRKLLLKAATVFERATSGIQLTDAHQGLRVFRRPFATALKMRSHDMAWASEFLTRIAETGASFEEFPVTVHYTEYSRGKGQRSINSVNIGVDILLDRFLRGR